MLVFTVMQIVDKIKEIKEGKTPKQERDESGERSDHGHGHRHTERGDDKCQPTPFLGHPSPHSSDCPGSTQL